MILNIFFVSVLCSRGEPTAELIPIGAKDTSIFMMINGVRACFAKFIVSLNNYMIGRGMGLNLIQGVRGEGA